MLFFKFFHTFFCAFVRERLFMIRQLAHNDVCAVKIYFMVGEIIEFENLKSQERHTQYGGGEEPHSESLHITPG